MSMNTLDTAAAAAASAAVPPAVDPAAGAVVDTGGAAGGVEPSADGGDNAELPAFNGEVDSLATLPGFDQIPEGLRTQITAGFAQKVSALTATMTRATQKAATERAQQLQEHQTKLSQLEQDYEANQQSLNAEHAKVAELRESLLTALAEDDGTAAIAAENRRVSSELTAVQEQLEAAKAKLATADSARNALSESFDEAVTKLRTDMQKAYDVRMSDAEAQLSAAAAERKELATLRQQQAEVEKAQVAAQSERDYEHAVTLTKQIVPWVTDRAQLEKVTKDRSRLAELELMDLRDRGINPDEMTNAQKDAIMANIDAMTRVRYPDPKAGVKQGATAEELAAGANRPDALSPDGKPKQQPFQQVSLSLGFDEPAAMG